MSVSLSLLITLVSCLILLCLFTYLAWFRPDRLRSLVVPPERIQKLLGPAFEPVWQVSKSEFSLWLARILGPIKIVIFSALLIWVFLCVSGSCP